MIIRAGAGTDTIDVEYASSKGVYVSSAPGRNAVAVAELTMALSWLAVVCYTLQIYFDFSGYSDMAIGLGLILGFAFPKNFDSPYRSASITEFWPPNPSSVVFELFGSCCQLPSTTNLYW